VATTFWLPCIIPGHQYAQQGRHQLTLAGLICPSHRFFEVHYQAPDMFVRPEILMSRDVSDFQILCYESAISPTTAPL
jgi:hypothetical protein